MITDYKEALKRLNHKRATTKSVTLGFEENETNKAIIEDVAIYNKLHELEDIEEEFGFDLSLFKKVLLGDKNGICFWSANDDNPKPVGPYRMNIDFSNLRFYSRGDYWSVVYYFKDYGKTWALTKEELK